MSKLLINEAPLQVLPSLAVAIGLNEAIFIQQLHYYLDMSRNEAEGKKWIYNTLENWQKIFKFWSPRTVQRTIKNVEEMGLVVSTDKFNKMKMDKTKWYSIDYEKLTEIEAQIQVIEVSQNDQMSFSQNDSSSWSNCLTPFSQNDQMSFSQNDQSNNQRIKRSITKNNTPLPPKGESANADVINTEDFPEDKKNTSQKSKSEKIDYQAVVDLYNKINKETGSRLSQAVTLNDKRKRDIKKFLKELKEPTLDCVEAYFETFFEELKPFHTGDNNRGWKATFDYAIRPDTVLKVREGNL
ncbi:hypothetical protein [Mannheimia massilioguelmaensis]|uniref:hypothetical protein n=1 Tax=Mannheimia massilioguelmaensis TaxID=1604354 RepID=UPI0005C80264|nr:hypothetical protein [Mannheimia massilioguelmaensis]